MAKDSKNSSKINTTKKEISISESFSETEETFFASEQFWRIGSIAVVAIAVLLRFYQLALKPFHHDEGVNGWFLTKLVREGVYQYDPANYHGPTLYYFSLASTYLFGLNDFAVRFVTSLFGVLTVILVLTLRRYLGTIGTLSAAMLLALSPGMSFISRYFIHEILFVFFTLGVAVGIVKFMERERVSQTAIGTMTLLLLVCLLPGTLNFANAFGAQNAEIRIGALVIFFAFQVGIVFLLVRSLVNWDNGRPIYLLLASASAVLTFATKETAFISLGTMLIALACIWIWRKIYQNEKAEKVDWNEPIALDFKTFQASFGNSSNAILLITLCIIIFLYVGALFFSSFFTHQKGIHDAFEAYNIWTKTGTKDHAENGLFAYLKWAYKLELPLLILAAIGSLIAFWKAKHRFAMFAALWAFGLFAAYTLIPYKTPWLALNFLMPMAIIAGYGINELAISRRRWQRTTAEIMALAAFGVTAYQTIDLNFYRFDDEAQPYVYAHTRRGYNDLIKEIERIAEISGKGKEASILVASPDYWAMPWSLRDYKNTAFYGQIVPSSTAEIIVGKTDQKAEIEAQYGAHYKYAATYPLRPGVDLMLYVRKDLADKK